MGSCLGPGHQKDKTGSEAWNFQPHPPFSREGRGLEVGWWSIMPTWWNRHKNPQRTGFWETSTWCWGRARPEGREAPTYLALHIPSIWMFICLAFIISFYNPLVNRESTVFSSSLSCCRKWIDPEWGGSRSSSVRSTRNNLDLWLSFEVGLHSLVGLSPSPRSW